MPFFYDRKDRRSTHERGYYQSSIPERPCFESFPNFKASAQWLDPVTLDGLTTVTRRTLVKATIKCSTVTVISDTDLEDYVAQMIQYVVRCVKNEYKKANYSLSVNIG